MNAKVQGRSRFGFKTKSNTGYCLQVAIHDLLDVDSVLQFHMPVSLAIFFHGSA
jgi:hypothetical protein